MDMCRTAVHFNLVLSVVSTVTCCIATFSSAWMRRRGTFKLGLFRTCFDETDECLTQFFENHALVPLTCMLLSLLGNAYSACAMTCAIAESDARSLMKANYVYAASGCLALAAALTFMFPRLASQEIVFGYSFIMALLSGTIGALGGVGFNHAYHAKIFDRAGNKEFAELC